MYNKKILIVSLIVLAIVITGAWWGISEVRSFLAAREERKEVAQSQKLEEVTITLLEGWTTKDIAEYLDKKSVLTAENFLSATEQVDKNTYPFLSTVPKGMSLEGFLFPDTYRILKGSTSEEILDKLLENFEKKFNEASSNTVVKQDRYIIPGFEDLTIEGQKGLSMYKIIILASIVEKETGSSGSTEELLEERKIVAGIFYNRLNIGMALESDATVNYATGKSSPSASLEDLEVNSPYNLYKYPGLTPGPIGNPSLSSLMAVLRPIESDYFYFLHKQPSGEVVYSKTFEEHVANKNKYLK